MNRPLSASARSNIELLESIQKTFAHQERFSIPLPTSALLELISSGSTGVTLPGHGHLWLTIVGLPPAPAINTVAEFCKNGAPEENNEQA